MSLITDIRAVSENAVEQIAARLSDLPRPLLAAIGAGDMAIERLAELRESLADSLGEHVSVPSVDPADLRSAVGDLPARAQKVAAEVAENIEKFAAQAPARAQEFVAQLPDKLSEVQTVAQSLSPDAARETVEAYTKLVGMIYGSLADRGGKRWTKVRAAGIRPGVVVDAAAAKVRPSSTSGAAPAASTRPEAEPFATVPGAPAATVPTGARTPKTPKAPKVPASKVVPPHVTVADVPAPARKAARTAAKPATPKSAAKPATPRSTAKPATPRATAKPATPKSAVVQPPFES